MCKIGSSPLYNEYGLKALRRCKLGEQYRPFYPPKVNTMLQDDDPKHTDQGGFMATVLYFLQSQLLDLFPT